MLKGREKLAGQKKLFRQSAGPAVTAFATRMHVCAWCKETNLPCQIHRPRGRIGSSLRTDRSVSLLSGSWWGLAPPAVSQVTVLLWEAPRSAAPLPRFSSTCYSVLCLTRRSLTGKSHHMYKSIFRTMSWHGDSRLAWMSTVVLAVLFFSRGDETAFWCILVYQTECSDDPTSTSWNSSFDSPNPRSKEAQGYMEDSSSGGCFLLLPWVTLQLTSTLISASGLYFSSVGH